jgi:ribosomal protein S18 acetylase RimI-like enzyme
MNKFTKITESRVDLGVKPLSTELIFLTENGVQVGSLLLVNEGSSSSVYSLEVLEKHRKKGYGKKLMEKAIKHCKSKGFSSINLNTEFDNVPANKLYQNLGFKVVGNNFGLNNYTLNL